MRPNPWLGWTFRTNVPGIDYGYLTTTIAFALCDAHIHISAEHFQEVGREFGGGRLAALILIGINDGLRQRDLGEVLGLAPSETVRIVDDLGSMGLVERQRSQSDRRAHALVLTKQGEVQFDAFEQLFRTHQQSVAMRLDADEQAELVRLLKRIDDPASDS